MCIVGYVRRFTRRAWTARFITGPDIPFMPTFSIHFPRFHGWAVTCRRGMLFFRWPFLRVLRRIRRTARAPRQWRGGCVRVFKRGFKREKKRGGMDFFPCEQKEKGHPLW